MQRIAAEPQRHRQPEWRILFAKAVLSDTLAQIFDPQRQLLLVIHLQQQQELLPAQPDDRLALSCHHLAQQIRQLFQHQIPDVMAKAVIDPLEMIQIQQQ